ncbi:MAG: Bax inhibitor-1 family protein [Oscillatoria princeps RMCB-10]|jgi:FtsH-binding integral membrane protein|nr:Bax inhibitor-1 family protein [Oscillatoria princeps RMCB-10]
MSNTSNFRQAMREAKYQPLVGPNVIANALPYLGGGLVLTAAGTYGGLRVLSANPALFMPTFWVALVLNLVLFFVAQRVAAQASNSAALPLLATYSLLTGYTLTGLVFLALRTAGVGLPGVGFAALGCGVTFIAARQIGSNLSEEDGMAVTRTVQLGIIALLVVLLGQLLLSVFGVYTPTWLEVAISGVGVFLFAGAAVVDFFVLPRTYGNDQYLSAALSMYLTYINLFIFILRLLIALNSRD